MNDSHLLFSLSRFQPESTTAFVHELKFLWIFYIWLWDWGMIIGSCTSTVQSPPALFWNLKVDLFSPGFLLKYPGLILLKFVFISFSLTYAKSGLSFCIPSLLFLFFFPLPFLISLSFLPFTFFFFHGFLPIFQHIKDVWLNKTQQDFFSPLLSLSESVSVMPFSFLLCCQSLF